MIDTDQWGDKIKSLRSFCLNNNISNNAWFVAQSNPCFEVWLYYHFFDCKPRKSDIDRCGSLKKFVDEKIPGGFDSRKMPAKIETAINHAKILYSETNCEPDVFCTEVYKLGEVIYPFVKDVL